MASAILFDLGNTLAAYYHADQFQPILRRSINAVLRELSLRGLPANVSLEDAMSSALAENEEASDYRFRPMEQRLERIFRVSLAERPSLSQDLCRAFLQPIFSMGEVYEDVPHTLDQLRKRGFRLAIVSNAPWGSPPELWREELQGIGLSDLVDAIVLCGDVGWRKPAAEIFACAARALDHAPDDCIFVGDDLEWDVLGSSAAGMRAILIDRGQRHAQYSGERIGDLDGLLEVVAVHA